MTCRQHPHTTPERAAKCYAKYVRRRVDPRLARLPAPRYRQVLHDPPVARTLPSGVRVYWYAEGRAV